MPVDFRDYFWGEGNNGFDVLYHNMKYGYGASKELADFFRERSVIEETHSKLLAKLAKHASNCCTQGTFAPFWQLLKASSEKLSTLHAQMVQRFQDLVKEVNKYCEEQHKRHKQVKEEESSTLEVVQYIQQTTLSLHKAKEMYNSRCLEFEKLKRENASLKEVEKAETKCKKACEEYRNYIEKYGTIRDDFQNKMTISCEHFQLLEESHLKQMKTFLASYAQVLESGHALIGQVHVEFRQQCNDMDLDKLLEQFVLTRGTGPDKPGPLYFEEADLSSLGQIQSPEILDSHNEERSNKKEGKKMSLRHKSKPSRRTISLLDLFFSSSLGNGDSSGASVTSNPSLANAIHPANDTTSSTSNPSNSDSLHRTTFRASKWFLKSKREKKKEKKKKKNLSKSESTDTSNDISEMEKAEPKTPRVDAEGFTIVPPGGVQENILLSEAVLNDKDSFYSSSDGESEDEEKERKIHIEIKPLSNGAPMSASVDELRATVGNLTLSPISQHANRRVYSSATSTPEDGPIKRSISASHPISKTEGDVFSLFSPTASSASTPTGAPSGIQSPTSAGSLSIAPSEDNTPTATNRYAALSEIFAEATQTETSEAFKTAQNGSRGSTPTSSIGPPTPTGIIGPPLLPRPPSRRALEGPTRGRMSPLPNTMTRTESIGSLTNDFKTTSMPVGSSRGPSPLTIGISDTIPLAVAFQEVVHAYFRGADESKCQLRLMGDMKVSFPAGIVQVLANNPSPAILSFKVTKASRLENILPNKQLIVQDPIKSSFNHYVYDFNMPALTSLLRKQYEQTPSASYFNIDILKYHIKSGPGATSTPLHLVAYWKCEQLTTDIRIDYKYHPAALASPASITNIHIIVPVDGGVTDMQSKPLGNWNNETSRASWKIPELSNHSEEGGLGSLRARFDLSSGPSIPSILAAQFICQGTSLSGAEFELIGTGYRLSLVKKQVIAGKYLCEADQSNFA
ncbi:F-BAR domain only protein 2 isoform X3 [Centruroides vittatus]|uniref:F-BAR domain only protein 2 isoform X3 n=1 Tax=Centruroides vittatus TaxID=120091 RepID=UPI00350F3ADD